MTNDTPIPKSIKIVKAGLILIFLNEYVGTLLIKSTATIKVNISKLEPGGRIVVEWRGKPVYIVRRTVESIRGVNSIAPEMLKDFQSAAASQPSYVQGAARTLSGKEEFLIILSI